MIRVIKRFFDFCGNENKKKFHIAMILSVFMAIAGAMRIPAVYIVLKGIVNDNLSVRLAWTACGIVAVSVILQTIIYMKSAMLQTEAGYNTAASKRIEIAEHLRYVPMGYFNKNNLGAVTSVATNTMEQLANVGTRVVILVTKGYLTTAAIIAMMFFFDVRIAGISFVGIAVFIFVSMIMQKTVRNISKRKIDADELMTGKVLEYVQGIAEIRNYGLSASKTTEVKHAVKEAEKASLAMEVPGVIFIFLQNIITKLTGCIAAGLSAVFYLNGSMELADCIMMIICSFMLFEALDQAGSYSALLNIIDMCVGKGEDALYSPVMDIEGAEIKPDNYNLEMENVSFSYGTRKVVDNISLSIPEGSCVALVGPSGGGKTTISQLLARFWDADSGKITLGGRDVKDYDYDSLIRNYSFVFQNVYLFNDTIANNIRFGDPDASLEKVTEAAKKACCHEFIMNLPNGYDTIIGEGGANLSGGEKQRISIARAIMKDAPIIILDEATANVDPENEEELMKAVEALTENKTVIMIAHRLKTVRNADKIYVIDKGRISEEGTHEELIKENGIYKAFIDARKKASGWRIKYE